MAFLCIKYSDVTIDKMHEKMALYYSGQGNYYKAYKEYYSLIKCYPYKNDLYLKGFDYLMKAKEYIKACDLLASMPGIDTSYSALIQIGKIYLDKNEFKKAIHYLEIAGKCPGSEADTKSYLYFIYDAYRKAGLKDKADTIAKKISVFKPQFQASDAERQKVKVVVLSEKARQYVETAKIYSARETMTWPLIYCIKQMNWGKVPI